MNLNRPDVAAILARKRILNDVKVNGRSILSAEQASSAFYDWPIEHINYFCNVHNLVIWASPEGFIEARYARDAPPSIFTR